MSERLDYAMVTELLDEFKIKIPMRNTFRELAKSYRLRLEQSLSLLLPATFYADKELYFRIHQMVDSWKRATTQSEESCCNDAHIELKFIETHLKDMGIEVVREVKDGVAVLTWTSTMELELRRLMWENHGHDGRYGDDGEMQCVRCMKFGCIDYKNAPIEKVRSAYNAAKLQDQGPRETVLEVARIAHTLYPSNGISPTLIVEEWEKRHKTTPVKPFESKAEVLGVCSSSSYHYTTDPVDKKEVWVPCPNCGSDYDGKFCLSCRNISIPDSADSLTEKLSSLFNGDLSNGKSIRAVILSHLRNVRIGTVAGEVDWDTVHRLLEPWEKVWHGDRSKFGEQYPQWMLDAAAELFAHDLCDKWSWDEYVAAAAVIIDRHYKASLK